MIQIENLCLSIVNCLKQSINFIDLTFVMESLYDAFVDGSSYITFSQSLIGNHKRRVIFRVYQN